MPKPFYQRKSPNRVVWQSHYYDHIIRDDVDALRIQTYIQNNIAKWSDDSLYES